MPAKLVVRINLGPTAAPTGSRSHHQERYQRPQASSGTRSHGRRARVAATLAGLLLGAGPAVLFVHAGQRPTTPRPAAPTVAATAQRAAEPVAPPAAAPPQPVATVAVAAEVPVEAEECRRLYRAHRWRQAAVPCAAAATATPGDATLAIMAAQAEFAFSRWPEARRWAERALTLDPSLADAYVIRGRVDEQAGDAGAARRDYREYLRLAPRGWHAARLRAVLTDGTAQAGAPANGSATGVEPTARPEAEASVGITAASESGHAAGDAPPGALSAPASKPSAAALP